MKLQATVHRYNLEADGASDKLENWRILCSFCIIADRLSEGIIRCILVAASFYYQLVLVEKGDENYKYAKVLNRLSIGLHL